MQSEILIGGLAAILTAGAYISARYWKWPEKPVETVVEPQPPKPRPKFIAPFKQSVIPKPKPKTGTATGTGSLAPLTLIQPKEQPLPAVLIHDHPDVVTNTIAPQTIREAVEAIIPRDPNIVSDIKVRNNLADVHIRWRTLRWSTSQAIAGRTPEQMAKHIDTMFREWLRDRVKNLYDANGQVLVKHQRTAADMEKWLKTSPGTRAWLYGDGESP